MDQNLNNNVNGVVNSNDGLNNNINPNNVVNNNYVASDINASINPNVGVEAQNANVNNVVDNNNINPNNVTNNTNNNAINNPNVNEFGVSMENVENYNNEQEKKNASKEMVTTEKICFNYKAKDRNGKIVRSSFDAYNVEQAKRFLENEGFEILEIKARSKMDFEINIGNVLSVSELSFMLTQLATYLRAGISLVDSVRIIAKQTSVPRKKKIYELIIYDLLAGDSFSASLDRQKGVFPKLLVNMAKTAELTGDLPNVLEDMADYYTSIDKTKKEIKSALTYPVIVLIFSFIVIGFVLVWVVPRYQSMFDADGFELPTITKITLGLSEFLQTKAIFVVLGVILLIVLYKVLFKKNRMFRRKMQNFYMHIPTVKNIIIYSEVSMFTKTFASLLNHGVFITDSIDVLMQVSENEVYRDIMAKTIDNISKGGKISEAFKDHWAFPIVAYEMIVTGENTGKLGNMMEKVYQYYDNLHSNAITGIKSLIEPVLLVFLAGNVGLIILSIILPMFEMYKNYA